MLNWVAFTLIILGLIWLISRATAKIAYSFIFFPIANLEKTPAQHDLHFEEVFFSTKDGIRLHGWFVPHENALATVLFLHGNAGNISHRVDELALWNHIGVSIFIIDYRGYGKSEGSPSEQGLYYDAQAAYQFLVEKKGIPSKEIVCFGRSLGGAVAIHLAHNCPLGALIVASTFTSIRDMVYLIFPRWIAFLPAWLCPVRMPSLQLVDKLNCSFLIVHGSEDTLIPPYMGKRLYDRASNPKMWYSVPEGGHNDTFIKGGKKYWYLIKAFIEKTIHNMGTGKE